MLCRLVRGFYSCIDMNCLLIVDVIYLVCQGVLFVLLFYLTCFVID